MEQVCFVFLLGIKLILIRYVVCSEVVNVANSIMTKKALATSLKDLMKEKSFEKISISDICGGCNMSRKSFYYHFKDKYDLANWIFETEFLASVRNREYEDASDAVYDMCRYLYDNKDFYKKALNIKGQNSFSDYFENLLFMAIREQLKGLLHVQTISDFPATFFTDAFVMAFRRWLLEYNDMGPEEFLDQLRICIKHIAVSYEDV